MENSPYVPVVAFDAMPLHAVASSPHTVLNMVPILVASLATASEGTHDDDATIRLQSVALGVGGSASAASQRSACTAGQARGWFVGV